MNGFLVYALLAILLTMILVQAFPVECRVSRKEGFEGSTNKEQYSCPEGSRSFINENGELMCCSGPVNGRKCEGGIVCTFSSTSQTIPFCGSIPRSSPAIATLLAPPDRGVKITDEEGIAGQSFFTNAMQILSYLYLSNVAKAQVEKGLDTSELKGLLADELTWKEKYAAKADSTVFAKEAKYIFTRLKTTNSFKQLTNAEDIYTQLYTAAVSNNRPTMEDLIRQTTSLEKELKSKNVSF